MRAPPSLVERTAMVTGVAIANLVTAVLHGFVALYISPATTGLFGGSWSSLIGDLHELRAQVGGLLAVLCVLDLLAARGVWTRRRWGRILAILLAWPPAIAAVGLFYHGSIAGLIFLACAAFPLVVLFNPRYAAEFPPTPGRPAAG